MSAEPTRDRLRRLRRESKAPGPEGEDDGGPKTVRSRLARRAARDPVSSEASLAGGGQGAVELAGSGTVGPPAGLERAETGGDVVHARRTRSESTDRHGSWALDEVLHADSGVIELLTGDAALADLDLSDAVYLDTETTGLSGGAGTWVFLVGLGRFVDEGSRFEVWQGFLEAPADERALLAETAERIADAPFVVSFFGKSFDRHRLEDKMRLFGVEPPFAGRPHLDLFHPLRRLYRDAFEDTRLQTMERELCGFEREDDLPGSFAPMAWFDYLADRPHRLEGVFEHNLHDVRSLVTLAAHLGRVEHETRWDGRPLEGGEADRAAGLARRLCEAGRRGDGLEWLARARGRRDSRELRILRADVLRLSGDVDAARAAYRSLIDEHEDGATARCWIELAKLAEHARGDPASALECCRLASAVLERTKTGASRARLARDLERRRGRLLVKIGSSSDRVDASDGAVDL